jgi:hypothetical protein
MGNRATDYELAPRLSSEKGKDFVAKDAALLCGRPLLPNFFLLESR